MAPAAVGVVPIPMFEVATRVRVFVVPATFTLVVKIFETTNALAIETLLSTRDERLDAPETFKFVEMTSVVVKAFEMNALPTM